jgi:hypothetical protein
VRDLFAALLVDFGSTLLRTGSGNPNAATGLSATDVAVIAAVIGAGGSVIGGIVGGWFTLRAGHRQWQRDREDSRTERSRQAALAVAEAVADMERAVATWEVHSGEEVHSGDIDALRGAFAVFSRTVSIQSMPLIDDTLRQRLRDHAVQVHSLVAAAGTTPPAADAISEVQRRADALIEALDAYQRKPTTPNVRLRH